MYGAWLGRCACIQIKNEGTYAQVDDFTRSETHTICIVTQEKKKFFHQIIMERAFEANVFDGGKERAHGWP